jgi:hypothetical protein
MPHVGLQVYGEPYANGVRKRVPVSSGKDRPL